jgi:hypothetical protein
MKYRYQKIKNLVEKVIYPLIRQIRRKNMPYKDIELVLKILYPKTKYHKTGKGFFKHVFIIHSDKKKVALKIGRSKKDIRKDWITYERIKKAGGKRYFASVYWRSGLFMLQKYGKSRNIPKKQLERLKKVGYKYKLKDIKHANIMKFGNNFKIVDAERSQCHARKKKKIR